MKKTYLNIGCGDRFHPDWVNIDMAPYNDSIRKVNILRGLPFEDASFDVVYHSQVIEHIPKEKVDFFISECSRVLKSGGIIRVACPDLENIASEYLRLLKLNLTIKTVENESAYDWIMLEMYDQTVRNYPGGEMGKWLHDPIKNKNEYVKARMGLYGKLVSIHQSDKIIGKIRGLKIWDILKKGMRYFKRQLAYFNPETMKNRQFSACG
jgi:predicted SAM-dependent methyltransferase